MYAPPTKNFVAIEPQYNLSDPFDRKVWGNQDTGVVYLKPVRARRGMCSS